MKSLTPALLSSVALLLLAGDARTLAAAGSDAREDRRPNVLFIAIDDLNDWVGPLGGHPQAQTPNMDRLAARGVTFLNAHCQSPLCNPSRTSVLTGWRPSTSGVYGLNPWFRSHAPLQDRVTLPQYFMQHGYQVVTTGKIFHDAYPPREDRIDGREFSVWGRHGGFSPRPTKKFVETPDPIALMDWGIFPERDEDCFDYDVATYAVDQLATLPEDKPFFLCVGFRHPHVPCYAPQKWFDLYPPSTLRPPPVLDTDRDDTPRFSWYLHWKLPEPRLAWLRESGEWMPLVRAYLASVSFVDAQLGRVLDALEARADGGNTVIVLWSDHGWHLGEKLISGKNSLWDRSTRVPLIFAGPGIVADARCRRPAELLDLYPTLVDLCGLPGRDGLDGHSLVPQLKDPQAQRPWPAITTHGPNNHAVRTGRWRYIRYADGSEELYDVRADGREWHNLAADPEHAAVKERLARRLPDLNAAPVPGSVVRLIELKEGVPFWEGKPIGPDDPIPD
ncbi:MAG: sulfatase [Verrucomicrobiales bacterium]|nr:sulfatase [Verrucomicrobiales bacterium]